MTEKKYSHLPLFQSQRPTEQTQGELLSVVKKRLDKLNSILENGEDLGKIDEDEVLNLLDGINNGVLDLVIDSKIPHVSEPSVHNGESISDLDYIKDYFFNYKGTKEESFVHFWNLKMNDILGITLKYNTFYQLCKASGYHFNERSIHAPVNFRKWLLWLFGNDFESLVADVILKRDDVENYFFMQKDSKEDSFLYFRNFGISDLRAIELKGKKILQIAMIAGYPYKRGNIASIGEFREFLLWLFGNEFVKVVESSEYNKANKVKAYFNNIKGNKKDSFLYLYELQQKDIQQISFDGMSLFELCKASGYPDLHKRIYLPNRFKNWILWLFGDEFKQEVEQKYEMTIKDIENYFFSHKGMTKEESFRYFMNFRTWQLQDIDIKGNKLYKICTISGFVFPRQVSVSVGKFQTWLRWFFWERKDDKIGMIYPAPEIVEDINVKKFFYNFEGRNKQESFEYLYGLNEELFSNIIYNGNSLRKTIALSGYTELPFRYTIPEFKKWLKRLFLPESENFLADISDNINAQNLLKVQKFFFNYEGKNKMDSFKYFIGLNSNDLKAFKFEDKSLIHAVNISSYPEKFHLTPKMFKDWLIWLFGDEFVDIEADGNPLTLSSIQRYFFNFQGKDKDNSYQTLIKFTIYDIDSISLNGFKIKSIVTFSGYPKEWSKIPTNFKEWINWLFFETGGISEELSHLEAQINFLMNCKGSKEESFKYLWYLKQREIVQLDIAGYNIYKFGRYIRCPGVESNPHTPSNFRKILVYIFGKEFLSLIPEDEKVKKSLSVQQIEDYFFNYEGRNKLDSFWYFYNFKREEIVKIKINGYGYTAIASVSGYGENSKNICSEGYFRDWLIFLFGEEYKAIVEQQKIERLSENNEQKEKIALEVKDFFYSYGGESKKDSFLALRNLTKKDLFALEYKGRHVLSLVTATGYNSTGISFALPSNFRNFLVWLFGEEYHAMAMEERENIKNSVINGLLYIKGTEEESYIFLYNLKQIELKDLIIDGRHIVEMARITGYECDFANFYNPSIFKQWIVWLFNKYSSRQKVDINSSNSFRTLVKNYFYTIRGTQEDSFWYLYNLNYNQISNLEFQGLKIEDILRKLDYSNPSHIRIPGNFRKWLADFFSINPDEFQKNMLEKGRSDLKNSSFLSLTTYIEGDREKTFQYFLSLSTEEISALRINGKKIIELANLLEYGECSPRVIYLKRNFIPFIFWVFSKSDSSFSKKVISSIFNNYEGRDKEESYLFLSSLSKEEYEKISLFGVSLIAILKISGFDLEGKPYISQKAYRRWLVYIFGEEGEKNLVKEKIKSYFLNYKGLDKSASFRALYCLGFYEILKLKFDKYGIHELITLTGFRGGYKFKKVEITKDIFREWLCYLYGDEFIEKEFGGLSPSYSIVRDFVFEYKGNKDDSFMYFLLANTVELRKTFKMYGLGLKNIVKFSGFDSNFQPNKESILQWIIYLYGDEYIKEKFGGIHPGRKIVQDRYFGYSGNKEDSFVNLYCAFEDERRNMLHIIDGTPYSTAIISGYPYDYPAVKLLTQDRFREFLTWIFWGENDIPAHLKERISEKEKKLGIESNKKQGLSLKENYYGEEDRKIAQIIQKYLGDDIHKYGNNAGRETIKRYLISKYGEDSFLELYFTKIDDRRDVLDIEGLGFLPTIRMSSFNFDCRVQNLVNAKYFRECIVRIFFEGYENIPYELAQIIEEREIIEKETRLENNLKARKQAEKPKSPNKLGPTSLNVDDLNVDVDSAVDDALAEILNIIGRKKEILLPEVSNGTPKYSKLDLYLGFKLPDLSLRDIKPKVSSEDYIKWMRELYASFPDLNEKKVSFQSFFTMLHEGGKFYNNGITRTEINFILTQNKVYKSIDEQLEEKIIIESNQRNRHEITEYIFSMHEGKPIEIIKLLYNLSEDKIDEISIKGDSIKFLMKNTQFATEYSCIEDYKKFICWLFFLDYPLSIN